MKSSCPDLFQIPISNGIEERIAALSSGEIYGAPGAQVEMIETHMSWVFLLKDQVFKMKKPVKFPFLNFTRLDDRERFVREEVRLNRRMAPSVYLGVSTLTRSADGSLKLDGKGEVVEWLVRMRRLPESRMLDKLISSGDVEQRDLTPVTDLLVRFYTSAESAKIMPDQRIARFTKQFLDDAVVLLDPCLGMDPDRVEALLDCCDQKLAEMSPVLRLQAEEGVLIDGHGDLRPEHVCMTDPPEIFDCIEFDPQMRMVDPYEEAVFLGLECHRLGAVWVTQSVVESLAQHLWRPPSPTLLSFYWLSKALMRARLSLAHLLDDCPRTPSKWRPLTITYLELAERADEIALASVPRQYAPPKGS
jgi:aminoglycoside phosphotransferase family enzyme